MNDASGGLPGGIVVAVDRDRRAGAQPRHGVVSRPPTWNIGTAVTISSAVTANAVSALNALNAGFSCVKVAPGSLPGRQDWQATEREPDPERQIALFASIATRGGIRSAAITEVVAAAAGADREIAAIYRQQRQDRNQDERRLARSLARKCALRQGLSETRPADVIWAIANAHTYRALVAQRDWSTDHERHRVLLTSGDIGFA